MRIWETDVFKALNRNMSWMWSGLFAASLVTAAIPGLFLPQAGWPTDIAFQVALPGALMLESSCASIKNTLPIINGGWALKTIH